MSVIIRHFGIGRKPTRFRLRLKSASSAMSKIHELADNTASLYLSPARFPLVFVFPLAGLGFVSSDCIPLSEPTNGDSDLAASVLDALSVQSASGTQIHAYFALTPDRLVALRVPVCPKQELK